MNGNFRKGVVPWIWGLTHSERMFHKRTSQSGWMWAMIGKGRRTLRFKMNVLNRQRDKSLRVKAGRMLLHFFPSKSSSIGTFMLKPLWCQPRCPQRDLSTMRDLHRLPLKDHSIFISYMHWTFCLVLIELHFAASVPLLMQFLLLKIPFPSSSYLFITHVLIY